MEKRALMTEIRSSGEGEDKRVSGMGIVYDQLTELWPGYKERINKGAVRLAGTVKSYFNHDPNQILSTIDSNPALEINDTENGMEYNSPIPPTSYGKNLEINLERGNVKGSSFAFDVPKGGDRMWEDEEGVINREIKELVLYEIGPVTDPAFVQTTANLRTAQEALKRWQQGKTPARNLREKRQKLADIL